MNFQSGDFKVACDFLLSFLDFPDLLKQLK